MIKIPRIPMIAWFIAAFVVLVVLGGVRGCVKDREDSPIATDTASGSAFAAEDTAWRKEAIGVLVDRDGLAGVAQDLRNRVTGTSTRQPATRTVYDTIIQLRTDTVIRYVRVDARGAATIGLADPDSSGHRPRTDAGVMISDCDRGWLITPSGTVCRTAPLGHLELFAEVTAGSQLLAPAIPDTFHAALGLEWYKSYRSTFRARAWVEPDLRLWVGARKGVRVF